jgi:hypothetical protein
LAAVQAFEYSSSVDSAGAPTAVVTPPGETATVPGAAVGVSELVSVVDDGFADADDEGAASSPPEEHPARRIAIVPTAA